MIANRVINNVFRSAMQQQNAFCFSIVEKKKQMELTLRTPYKTICQDFSGFHRIITKELHEILVIQNRMPPALFVLPPGFIKIKLTQDTKDFADEYIHTGGWAIIHTNNTLEINLMDAVEKKEVNASLIDKVEIKDVESLVGKYVAKARRQATKNIAKRFV